MLLLGILISGCAEDPMTRPEVLTMASDPGPGEPITQVRTAYLYVSWPFEDAKSNWAGWQGERSGGAPASLCNGTRNNTHSGADYCARNLSQTGCYYAVVKAGFNGKVIWARADGCYGKTVVLYDSGRHVALRYSHLSVISVAQNQPVTAGQMIGRVGNDGGGCGLLTGAHLHLSAYENINDNQGNPIIPTVCDSEYYTCRVFF